MKSALLFVFSMVSFYVVSVRGQNVTDTLPDPVKHDSAFITPYNLNRGLPQYKKVSFGLEMGTSFGISSGNGSLFGVYASPFVRYKVSPRFNVNFGATISNSNYINYINPYGIENTIGLNNNITQTFLYAEGQYQVNNRLVINAKGYKEIYNFDEPQINPRALDLNGGGVAFGFQYKVTDNFHFGAEVGLSNGRTPYNPYSLGGYGNSGFNSFGITPLRQFDPW